MSRLLDQSMPHFEGETGAATGGSPPAAAPPAPSPAAPQPPAAPPASASDDRVRHLESELAAARQEAAGYRTGNKGQIKDFREALGLKADEDLASIPKRLAAMESENRQLKIDHALADVYGKHGVHPELTRKLLFADGVLNAIDPAQADFSKALNAAVKDLADKYPQVKIAAPTPSSVAPRSGPDLPPGGAGTPPQLSKEDLSNMSPPQIAAALKAGQLNGLLKRGG